jgi:hypothetical protein
MGDDFYKPNRPPAPPQGELLFEFLHRHNRYRCELRDHGEPYGVEAQFLKNEKFFYSRRFDSRMHAKRTPRDLAIAWAEKEREAMQRAP